MDKGAQQGQAWSPPGCRIFGGKSVGVCSCPVVNLDLILFHWEAQVKERVLCPAWQQRGPIRAGTGSSKPLCGFKVEAQLALAGCRRGEASGSQMWGFEV